ncbi:hypothetical protein L1987_34781 [Smallanthus sonchifolius]|uniref:Uncharacterized protein n=1 Tax=Smallanthus sonchifolius TaxID=185202 RepID=A0ACB9HVL8_9ASTR|nr:hypothetical protein L1987_34781 [Smallanthus sonchifolius]
MGATDVSVGRRTAKSRMLHSSEVRVHARDVGQGHDLGDGRPHGSKSDVVFDFSDKRMEGDEGLRTVECLRGRLLAERAASKAANDESEQISKKVIELEKQLKMEIKSRNKAEKRLKFLMKKLDSLNISYVSADESSSLSEKSDISSSKSQPQIELQKTQFSNISKCVMNTVMSGERHNCPSHEDNLGALDEAISGNSTEIQSSQKDGDEYDLQKEDNNGPKSFVTHNINDDEEQDQGTYHNVDNSMALITVEEKSSSTPMNGEDNDDTYDNSMALVVVDSMVKKENKEVLLSNGNVKDVLDGSWSARLVSATFVFCRLRLPLWFAGGTIIRAAGKPGWPEDKSSGRKIGPATTSPPSFSEAD